jgi:hypothetical protein
MVLVDPSFHADLKVPWDLSRGHQMVRLGQAYWLTNDERFAEELMKQWVSWVDENPYIQTCNWGNAMETAIRAANWLAAFTLTRDSEAQTSAIRQRFLCATLEHGRFIAGNLEKFEGNPTSNHYLSDLVGLVYLGVLTPWFKESKVWLEMGLRGLEVETLTQVGADGFDYEGSINYHRLVGELLLSAFALARANGHAISDAAWSRALAMPETTLQYTRPDGRAPLIGDVDNGRLHWFTPETPDDHRSLLGLASALTGRPDYAHAAGRALAEGFWWNEVPKPDASADLRSRYFENSGLAVLRNRHAHVVVHCGEPRGPRGHFHNDLLSVEVSLRGAAWIIDPGTFEYTKSESDRNHFRRTRAHNTVQIGDEEMNEIVPGRLFDLVFTAAPSVDQWSADDRRTVFAGSHRGFAKIPGVSAHRRTVALDDDRPEVSIEDVVEGNATGIVVHTRFHLDANVRADLRGNVVVLKRTGTIGEVQIDFGSSDSLTVGLESDWIARGYGRREAATVVVATKNTTLPYRQNITIKAS